MCEVKLYNVQDIQTLSFMMDHLNNKFNTYVL